ncbi:hypothetical protein C8R43DRAFT_1044971 [Mycena crocata]|nr:hypothetical protein C8R43DRAFT_1044971 [Mycena crocata]
MTGFEQQCFSPSPILDDPVAQAILSRALADGIDLSVFSFTAPALQEILSWVHFEVSSEFPRSLLELVKNATAIDVHVHYAPKWYGNIRQDSTEWTLKDQMVHMANQSIAKSIFSVPDPNIYLGDEYATVAIARLLNENMAALARALPHQFGFFATIPLPYVDAAIIEGQYALESLDAVGVAVNSNHEGLYLGNLLFDPFFAAMANSDTIVFVHPTAAVLKINQTFVEANPTIYSPILAEFYFETGTLFKSLFFKNATEPSYLDQHGLF